GNPFRGEDERERVMQVWHEMMALAQAPQKGDENELRTVLESYLQHLEREKVSKKTRDDWLGFYKDFLSLWPSLKVKDLKPFHIIQWWDRHPKWGQSMRNLTATAIKSALNWAAGADGGQLIPRNPLSGMKLPRVKARGAELVVSDEEFGRLMSF